MKKIFKLPKLTKQKGLEVVEVIACIAIVLILLGGVFHEQLELFISGLFTKLNSMSTTGIFS